MLSDALELSFLYDAYGQLLTQRQRQCFELHYNQDLSLSEIAENENISRQGAHDAILRAEQSLRRYEQLLGCVARDRAFARFVSEVRSCLQQLQDKPDAAQAAQCLQAALSQLKE